jgi:hypothetical protein
MKIDLWKTERDKAENIDGLLLVLKYETSRGPALKIWKPKAIKPHVNYYYASAEDREKEIQKEIASAQSHIKAIHERKQSRKGTPEQVDDVKIGDIFHFSWGYDQTNVDFYQVIDKRGYMLTLREIDTQSTGVIGNGMADYCVAVKDSFVPDSKPFTKRMQFSSNVPYINMKSYGWCSLYDGKPTYRSWYA